MRKLITLALVCLMAASSSVFAQRPAGSDAKLADFKSKNPKVRFFGQQYFDGEGFFEGRAQTDIVYGTILSTGITPQDSANKFCKDIAGIYASELGELVPNYWEGEKVLQGVMWDPATETHGFYTFRYNQNINGVPVFRSGIGFLVRNEDEFPVVMTSNNFKEMENFNAELVNTAKAEVSEVMLQGVREAFKTPNFQFNGDIVQSVLANRADNDDPTEISEEEVVIWAGVSSTPIDQPRMAVQFFAAVSYTHLTLPTKA